MASIGVDSARLAWLGRESERQADGVASAAPAVSGGFGATSAAVRMLHRDVDGAAQQIAGRLRSTGETVSNIGREFAVTEATNEDLLYEV